MKVRELLEFVHCGQVIVVRVGDHVEVEDGHGGHVGVVKDWSLSEEPHMCILVDGLVEEDYIALSAVSYIEVVQSVTLMKA